MNILQFLFMKANIVPYNSAEIDDEGLSSISIFNNDFGYKIFSYDDTAISFSFNIDYMQMASWFEEWEIEVQLLKKKSLLKDDYTLDTIKKVKGELLKNNLGLILVNQVITISGKLGDQLRIIV